MDRVCLLLALGAVLIPTSTAIFCPNLGDFPSEGTFEGWPDPTCPGTPGLDLVYELYTLDNPTFQQPLERDNIPSNFQPFRETIFLIHGWNGDASSAWPASMKNMILQTMGMDMNVVIVGWGGNEGAGDINYFRSASDTRTVGAETAEIMRDMLEQAGGVQDNMHCVGHSLGAHVCGHFGRWASDRGFQPARVTGLDPAGPFFSNNSNTDVGIYMDSAVFVDIIHTDAGLGSTPDPDDRGNLRLNGLGHVDFYPNDGDNQPGCASNGCDHGRAYELLESSFEFGLCTATDFCTSADALPRDCSPCGLSCGEMGYGNELTPRGIYRMDTSGGVGGRYCLT